MLVEFLVREMLDHRIPVGSSEFSEPDSVAQAEVHRHGSASVGDSVCLIRTMRSPMRFSEKSVEVRNQSAARHSKNHGKFICTRHD